MAGFRCSPVSFYGDGVDPVCLCLLDEGFEEEEEFFLLVFWSETRLSIYTSAAFIRVARNMGIDDWVLAVLSAVCGRALELAVERFDLACGGRAVPCKARKASGWLHLACRFCLESDGTASCCRARVSCLSSQEPAYTLTPARSPALPHIPTAVTTVYHYHYLHLHHQHSTTTTTSSSSLF